MQIQYAKFAYFKLSFILQQFICIEGLHISQWLPEYSDIKDFQAYIKITVQGLETHRKSTWYTSRCASCFCLMYNLQF